MRPETLRATLACSLVTLVACSKPPVPEPDLRQVWRLANRGVVELEQFQPARAEATWKEVLALVPDWTQGRINLGIATLNKGNPEDELAAIELFRDILAEHPDEAEAHYCMGILLARQPGLESVEEAAGHFRAVLDDHPDDASTLYLLGAALYDLDRVEEARDVFERSIALEPLNRSAWYQLGTARADLGDFEGQARALKEFETLRASDRSLEFKTVYGKMGPLAAAIRDFDLPRPDRAPVSERAVVFHAAELSDVVHGGPGGPATPGSSSAAALSGGAAAADLDQDGDFDLVLANFGRGPDVHVLENDGGELLDASEALGFPAGDARTIAVAPADFDGDALPELFLGRDGPDRLLAREAPAGESAFTREIECAAGSGATTGVAVGDLDQDGDLDLALARENGLALLLWDGSRFSDVTAESGVTSGAAVLSVLAADYDGDGDLDLVTGAPSPTVWLSDRLWGFTKTAFPAAGSEPFASVALGDVDGDTLVDWVLSSPNGAPRLLRADPAGGFVRDEAFGRAAGGAAFGSTLLDVDRDGDLDCFLVGSSLRLVMNDGAGSWSDATDDVGLEAFDGDGMRGHVFFDLDTDGDLDLAAVRNGGAPLVLKNVTEPGNDWIGILARGFLDPSKARGKSLGIGARVEVVGLGATRAGYAGLGGGFASVAPPALHFNLAGEERVNLRILWADRVQQAELDLAAGTLHAVEQHDREPSSCPIVFFWNGDAHEYLTDCLGVGGIGFMLEPGAFGPPDPEEVVRIGERLVPRDGRYEVLLAEPMEEVVYLDEASLIRVEHPAGTRVHPDERFATDENLATGRPLLLREDARVFPTRAVSRELEVEDRRLYTDPEPSPRDDLASVLEVDRDYAAPLSVHQRLLGYGAPWATELAFPAEDLAGVEGPVFLFVHGWVEYPFSRLNYAAWQGNLRMESWTLEVPGDAEGEWRSVLPEFGYPAGKPRTMALEITPWLSDMIVGGELRLRLSSNLVVSIDQVFLAEDVSEAALASGAMRVHEVHPSAAELVYSGFPREYSPDGQKPLLFDHANRDSTSSFKALAGRYTEYGDALDLLLARDDRFAIYARGDEMELFFDPADFPERDVSSRATFLLRVRGYCKDMCPHTSNPDTIEPLPFAAMENYPPEAPLGLTHPSWLSSKNTRREPPRPVVR